MARSDRIPLHSDPAPYKTNHPLKTRPYQSTATTHLSAEPCPATAHPHPANMPVTVVNSLAQFKEIVSSGP